MASAIVVLVASAWPANLARAEDSLQADIARLIVQMSTEESEARRTAAEELGAIGANAKVAVPTLVAALEDESGPVRAAAAAILRKLIREIGPPLAGAPTPATTALAAID
ncbi:MAG: HEAT repeat domain-containing protein [Alphaproteobacteria bacterium]|jgi:HEAT repeat protein|nr:HEAT repeat domain-containing protein [Alphaproteobacteria bacterium]MDP6517796.1 HEAT repeat domain-containing protein [Alphaproteobacteria bacterium]